MSENFTQKLISIIIPCYNYGHFIAETLDSVIAQTYKNWECIIVDDGSTDNSYLVCNEYCSKDSRISYHYKNNAGLSAARNTGIKISKGDYIQFLDADDILEPDKLNSQISLFNFDNKIDIVYGEARYFYTEKPNLRLISMSWDNRELMPKVSNFGNAILVNIIQGNITPVNCPLVKKSVIEKVGLFNEKLIALEDWEYWFRCALKNFYFSFHSSPNSLCLIRSHSISMSKNIWKMASLELNLRNYFNQEINNEGFRKLNNLYILKTKRRMVREILLNCFELQFKLAKQRLFILTNKTNTFSILVFLFREKIFPELTFKMIFYKLKEKINL